AVAPSTPAVRAPRLVRTRSHATSKNAGSVTRLNRSSNRRLASPVAQRCSFVWIPSTRPFASTRLRLSAPVFTGGLLTFQSTHCELAAALGHVIGFPDLGLLRRLRPAPMPSTDDEPSRRRPGWPVARGAPARFPRSPQIPSTGSAPSYAPAAI